MESPEGRALDAPTLGRSTPGGATLHATRPVPALDLDGWASLLHALPSAAFLLDDEGTVLAASPRAAFLLGDSSESAGRRLVDIAFAEPERGGFEEVLGLALRGAAWEGDLLLTGLADAPPVVARFERVAGPEPGSRSAVLLGLEQLGPAEGRTTRLAERLTRLARVAAELQAAVDQARVTDIVVAHLADAAGATTASLNLMLDETTLEMVGLRGGIPGASARYRTFPVDASTPAGLSLLQREPVVLCGRQSIEERFPTLPLAAPGERSLLCLPLLLGERPVGVATLTFPSRRDFDAAELDFFRIIADTCAQALERVRTEQALADQTAKLEFMVRAGEALAESLDYESTLRNVAWLAVPGYADWCSVSLDQDGILRTLAVAHRDPAKVASAEEMLTRYPPDPESAGGSYEVMRTGQTLLVPEIPDELLVVAAVDDRHLELLRALELGAVLSVPLSAREKVFGVMSWGKHTGSRPFTSDDITFAETLASRAAIAIDNAHLHTDLRRVADRLHETVLPPRLPEVTGWHLAATYSSAGRAGVGGDFYDVLPLTDGRLALVIGDVMGRGVDAAAAMSQIRAMMRAIVVVDPDPLAVLNRLDLAEERYPSDQLVTLLYAVADPASDELHLACAGHPAPLLVQPSRAATYVEAASGTLLGVAPPEPRRAVTLPFPPGTQLLMFTDGLLERRGEDLQVSRVRLLEAVEGLPERPDEASLADLVAAVRDPGRDDDVALLAAQRLP